MPVFMDMKKVKAEFIRQFAALDYVMAGKRHADLSFYFGNSSYEVEATLKNASPKKCEITITAAEKSQFLVPAYPAESGPGFEIYERFNKTPAGVTQAIQWMAKTRADFTHLRQALGMEALPPPRTFTTGIIRWGNGYASHGEVQYAEVNGVVSLRGIDVVHDIENPGTKVWYQLELNVMFQSMRQQHIITDGTHWYPVLGGANGKFKVISQHVPAMELNAKDHELVCAIVTKHVQELTKQSA